MRTNDRIQFYPYLPGGIAALRSQRIAPDLTEALSGVADYAGVFSMPGGAGIVFDVQGTMHCTSLIYFKGGAEGLRLADGPPSLAPEPDECWDSIVELVSISGQPTLLVDNWADEPRITRITAVPRTGTTWGRTCRVEARFSQVLRVEGAFCGPGVDCKALEAQALALAQSAERQRRLPPAAPALRAIARTTPDLDVLPFADHRGFTDFDGEAVVALPNGDRTKVAVVGPGKLGWRPYDGHLVAIWAADGKSLKPLAGFQILRTRGVLQSVTVRR